MHRASLVASAVLVCAASGLPGRASAGGGPLDVLVLFNASDPEAAITAEHYARARDIPGAQLCGLAGPPLDAPTIAFEDYLTFVRAPFEACRDALPDPGEIDYAVVVRGLPYRVDLPDGGYHTSLSAMLQIGRTHHEATDAELAGFSAEDRFRTILNPFFPHDSGADTGDYTLDNPTAAAYTAATWWTRQAALPPTFRRRDASTVNRWVMDDELLIVTRLDGFDHDDARALVDRAVAADGTFPDAELLCMAAADTARGARDPECEYTTRMLRSAGFDAPWLPDHDAALAGREVAAYFTGAAGLTGAIDGQNYAPGAIVDNLTSFGAVPRNWFCSDDGAACPEDEAQTSIARFVRAGATGVHGAVAEPFNPVFPNAGTLLLYTAGYNLGESFFFNQRWLYWQNLYVGDPLTTPYAERPTISAPVEPVPGDEVAVVTAAHPDGVRSLRLYRDGALAYDGDGDQVVVDLLDLEVGESAEFFAVATSEDAPVERPGWPVQAPIARPRVQGWATVTLTRGPDPAPDDPGCDCSGASPSLALLLLSVPLARRRLGAAGRAPGPETPWRAARALDAGGSGPRCRSSRCIA